MSVEAPKVVEETPVSKPVATEEPEVSAPKATETPAVAEATVAAAITSDDAAPAPATENPTVEGNTVVGATPASEGVLGYKEHGFLKSLRYSKHFFWFGEEPSTAESLAHFTKAEKTELVHNSVAWAVETGNGVLFYTKRSEDKATPAGLIVLADASAVLKEGTSEFSFTIGKVHHRFQANTSTERDSWIVALEKKIEEAKAMKEEITSRDSFKKTVEGFAVAGPTVAAATRSSSKGPKKSLDAATATAAATEPAPVAETASTTSAEADKKNKKDAEKLTKKERSQSRKRASIFGMLGKKDEEKDVKKEEKAEKKAEKEQVKEEKKIEKEHIKEEKKIEAEEKKEEAKATHDSSKAVEAAEAAAVAAVPAAAIVAAEKKEDKKDEEVVSPTEKKNKRNSVFGSLFGKKSVTSPTAEKTEKEAVGPIVPTKETEIPPVSETAPKLDEPIETKPIDTAAVTAPVDAVETPVVPAVAPVEEPAKENVATPAVPATETTTPKTEKKGGFLSGLMKKVETKKEDKKEEKKEEEAAEQIAKDPVAAASANPDSVTEPTVEAPVAETTEAKEERPAREKRRTSFFSSLGTIKKKDTETTEAGAPSEIKREKSPLPSKIGSMFRKTSRPNKPTETPAETEATKTEETVEPTTAATEDTESKIVGDVVPDELHAVVHNEVTTSPEVKASA